jgi:hypothetical protein
MHSSNSIQYLKSWGNTRVWTSLLTLTPTSNPQHPLNVRLSACGGHSESAIRYTACYRAMKFTSCIRFYRNKNPTKCFYGNYNGCYSPGPTLEIFCRLAGSPSLQQVYSILPPTDLSTTSWRVEMLHTNSLCRRQVYSKSVWYGLTLKQFIRWASEGGTADGPTDGNHGCLLANFA